MDASEVEAKCAQADNLKKQGNGHFTNMQYTKALRAYHQANLYLTGLIDKSSPMSAYSKQILTEESALRVSELKFSIYMNMSQIYIYQNKYDKGLYILNEAGKIKENTKLRFRKGVCLMHMGEFDEARKLFEAVRAEDASAQQEVEKNLEKIKDLEKAADAKAKKMYSKFFA